MSPTGGRNRAGREPLDQLPGCLRRCECHLRRKDFGDAGIDAIEDSSVLRKHRSGREHASRRWADIERGFASEAKLAVVESIALVFAPVSAR